MSLESVNIPSRKSENEALLTVGNNELITFAISYLSQDKNVRIPLKGSSMRPFLEGGEDSAILTLPHPPVLGEPVLALLDGKHWVLHRIIRIDGSQITMLGDGNYTPERCEVTDIKASVIGFYRKGRQKPDYLTGSKWRWYSMLWMKLKPVRRYLLFCYKLLLSYGIRP